MCNILQKQTRRKKEGRKGVWWGEIPTGTQISGSKCGLKACPIFKGQLEVIIIRLCDSFSALPFLSFSLTRNPIQICSHGPALQSAAKVSVRGKCSGRTIGLWHWSWQQTPPTSLGCILPYSLKCPTQEVHIKQNTLCSGRKNSSLQFHYVWVPVCRRVCSYAHAHMNLKCHKWAQTQQTMEEWNET